MKKLLMMATFFVVALVTTFALTSCGDDDDTEYQATETSVVGTWSISVTNPKAALVFTLNKDKTGKLYMRDTDGKVQSDNEAITWAFSEDFQSTVYIYTTDPETKKLVEKFHLSNLKNIGSSTLEGYYNTSKVMQVFTATKQ